jgi:type II secretory pathway pseudopilin PulG
MKKTRNNTKIPTASGFTLLETIVSLGILTIVVLIGIGALFTIVHANRKAHAEKSVMDNLQFAVEGMVRSLRVGNTYHCGASGNLGGTADCPTSGDTAIAFEPSGGDPNSESDQVVYTLDSGAIVISTDGGGSFLAVTAPEVVVDNLHFYVAGATVATEQPRVLIVLKGHVGTATSPEHTNFSLQTLVSQRVLD